MQIRYYEGGAQEARVATNRLEHVVHPLIRSILPLSVTNIEPLISVSQNKTLGAFVQYGFLRLHPLLCSFPTIHIPIPFRRQLVHFQCYAKSAGRLNDSWCLSSNPPQLTREVQSRSSFFSYLRFHLKFTQSKATVKLEEYEFGEYSQTAS
jgi:hypothetical protein